MAKRNVRKGVSTMTILVTSEKSLRIKLTRVLEIVWVHGGERTYPGHGGAGWYPGGEMRVILVLNALRLSD